MTILPPEIYGLVAEYIPSRHDLASLCRVSSAFYLETERVLYRAIHLIGRGSATRAVNPLLDRLSITPRQALLVQTFEMVSTRQMHDSTEIRLATALQALNNLRDLRILIPHVRLDVVTRGCTFQLRRFGCYAALRQSARLLQDFLLHQPLIRHLSVPTYGYTNPMPEDILPHLDTLLCSWTLAYALGIIRRPIKRLSWQSNDRTFLKSPQCPHPTLLVLVLNDFPYDYDLPTSFPNIRLLECLLPMKAASLPVLVGSIKGFRYLHTLKRAISKSLDDRTSSETVDLMAPELMESVESLQLVQIGLFQMKRGSVVESRQFGLPWDEWIEGF